MPSTIHRPTRFRLAGAGRRLLVLAALPFAIGAVAQPAAPAGTGSAPPPPHGAASSPRPPMDGASHPAGMARGDGPAGHHPPGGPKPGRAGADGAEPGAAPAGPNAAPMPGASAAGPTPSRPPHPPHPPHPPADAHLGGPAGRPAADAGRSGPSDAAFEAQVSAYLLSPEAEPAGLLFDDGREVRVPPHQGAALAALVKPGERVRVGALDADAPGPHDRRSIASVATGKSLVDAPPTGSPTPPATEAKRTPLQPLKVSGTIKQTLRGPRGETRGLLLADGTQVSFPPHVAAQAAAWITPGSPLNVDGFGRKSAYGTALQATSLAAPGGATVQVYGPPAPR